MTMTLGINVILAHSVKGHKSTSNHWALDSLPVQVAAGRPGHFEQMRVAFVLLHPL